MIAELELELPHSEKGLGHRQSLNRWDRKLRPAPCGLCNDALFNQAELGVDMIE